MLNRLLYSIFIGVVIATALLLWFPELKIGGGGSISSRFNKLNDKPISFNLAVRLASPAVVNVYNRSINPGNQTTSPTPNLNLGSGVIMNDKGYILTNKHVISDADQIIVALQDGRIFEALVAGSDSLTDLAVLKIQASDLPVITINPTRIPYVGDVVLAIGNPYNLGQTITQGIISATGRNGLSPSGRQHFLQTDASINHGNSGGALVNTLGELVGINTLSLDKSKDGEIPEGIGFAIPTLLATKVMEKLIRDGRVIRGYIGIEGREVVSNLTRNTLDREQIQGIIVNAINPAGPASRAGILPGDIIISANGREAVSAIEVMDSIAEIRPGTVIPIQILRGDKIITLQITIMEYPAN